MDKYTWLNYFKSLLNSIVSDYDKFSLAEKFHMLFPDKFENFKCFDPLSYILYLNTGNYERRLSLFNRVYDIFHVEGSRISDFNGILEPNDLNPVFFKQGLDKTLTTLWDFAKKINENVIDKTLFNTIANFKGVGLKKLSSFLYLIKPEEFYPATDEMQFILKTKPLDDFDSYLSFIQKAKETGLKPYELYAKAVAEHGFGINTVTTNALNRIIYGAVGTGKTERAISASVEIITGDKKTSIDDFKRLQSEGRIKFITFHKNRSYDDFVFKTFYSLCKNAMYDLYKHSEETDRDKFFQNPYGEMITDENEIKKYVLIIDEINRGNIEEIFGELITLIESNKRWGFNNGLAVEISKNGMAYRIPKNLYIIGTMNSVNTNIMDTTLRRRFDFIPMYPDYNYMKQNGIDESIIKLLKRINLIVRSKKTPDYQIGHSYLMDINEKTNTLENVLNKRIIPLLMQYFNNNQKEVEEVLRRDLLKRLLNDSGIQIVYDEDGLLKAV